MKRDEYVTLKGRKFILTNEKGIKEKAVVQEIDFDIGLTVYVNGKERWCINREKETTKWSQGIATHTEIDIDIDWAVKQILKGKLNTDEDTAVLRGHAGKSLCSSITCAFK